jgi:CBS-domain-containing membrane protein
MAWKTFIVVGAGHFLDEQGIIRLLENVGYINISYNEKTVKKVSRAMMMKKTQANHLGVQLNPISHVERVVSTAGIFAVYYVTQYFTGVENAALIVASMGASAVLLFAVPHGALAQPL